MNALKPVLAMPAMIYLLAIVSAATFGCGDPRISIPDAAETGHQTRRPSDPALHPTTPTIIDLGHVVQGSAIRRAVTIQNSGNSRWGVDHVWTSCECLTFKGLTESVPPGGSLSGMVELDLSDDPGFVGGLKIEARLLDESKKELACFEVDARVVLGDPDAAAGSGRHIVRERRSGVGADARQIRSDSTMVP